MGKRPDRTRTGAFHARNPEWIFLRDGHAFGPIPEARLRELIAGGDVDAETPVSFDGGPYRPLGEMTAFLVDLKKAEARARVELEITDSRRLERRRRLFRGTAGVVVLAVAVAAALGSAVWLATARPWKARNALLEDFGSGIAIAVPARVGAGRPRGPDDEGEVAVPVLPDETSRRPRPARDRPVPGPGSAASPRAGDLVVAQWDAGDIQAVVAREQRALAPCLRAEASRSPDFRGEIPIEFAIGNEGRVEALWIDEPLFRSGPLRDCLWRVLQAWRFRSFPGQRPVVSLSFRVGR